MISNYENKTRLSLIKDTKQKHLTRSPLLSPIRNNGLNMISPPNSNAKLILSPLNLQNKSSPVNGGKMRIPRPVLSKNGKFNSSIASTVNSTPTNSGMSDVRVKKINFGSNSGVSEVRE